MRVLLVRIAVVCLLIVAVPAIGACAGLGGREGPNQAELAKHATVSVTDARAAAVAAVPGSVQGMRLDKDAGRVVYAVLVQPVAGGQAQEVEVDANSGQLVKTRPARDREDDGD
jgi:protein-disulfide isomerase